MKPSLAQIAKSYETEILEFRKVIHQKPELRWEENETIEFLRKSISEIKPAEGRKIKFHKEYKGGLVVDLFFSNVDYEKKKMRLFRADIDALPIEESEDNEPKSSVEGKAHACGHDIHTSMLFVSLKILATKSELQPKHNLRYVFQRAEENPGLPPNPKSGGDCLVHDENVLDNVQDVYGLHIWALYQTGVFFSLPGAFLGNSAKLRLSVEAQGGHVCAPHRGGNALVSILDLRNILEETALRNKDPLSVLSITPVTCHAGNVDNVMPSHASMTLSFRNLMNTEERDRIFSLIEKAVRSRGKQLNVKVDLKLDPGYPTLINTPEHYRMTKEWIEKEGLEVSNPDTTQPILAGEDFSFFLKQRPGIMWCMGGSDRLGKVNGHISGPHHSPKFNPDPTVFWKGVLYWLTLSMY